MTNPRGNPGESDRRREPLPEERLARGGDRADVEEPLLSDRQRQGLEGRRGVHHEADQASRRKSRLEDGGAPVSGGDLREARLPTLDGGGHAVEIRVLHTSADRRRHGMAPFGHALARQVSLLASLGGSRATVVAALQHREWLTAGSRPIPKPRTTGGLAGFG